MKWISAIEEDYAAAYIIDKQTLQTGKPVSSNCLFWKLVREKTQEDSINWI